MIQLLSLYFLIQNKGCAFGGGVLITEAAKGYIGFLLVMKISFKLTWILEKKKSIEAVFHIKIYIFLQKTHFYYSFLIFVMLLCFSMYFYN